MKFLTNLDLNKNELQNVTIQNLATAPSSPKAGMIYFNTADGVFYGYTGTAWIDLGQVLTGSSIVTLINVSTSKIDDDNLSANVNDAISKKHDHSNKVILDATTASFLSAEKTKLSGIASGAEVNQNAYSSIKVGGTTANASSKTDSVEFIAGTGITLAIDTTNGKKITINGVNQYVHPSTHSADMIVDGTTNKVFTTAEKTKLAGIESGADVTDAENVASVINGTTAKATPVDADTIPLMNSASSNVLSRVTWANIKSTLKTYFDTLYNKYTHPNHSGDVTSTGDGATVIGDNKVTNAKLADMATGTIKGRVTAGTGDAEDLTATQVRTLINVADGATKNDTDANLKNRANHTGTQLASTISDFASTVLSTVLTGLSTATNSAITVTDTVLSALGKLQAQVTASLSTLTSHVNATGNVHNLTKADINLGDVDNTPDANKVVLSASKFTGTKTITLTGDVSGSVSTDFSTNPSITVTVNDDLHNHIISNVDGLQGELSNRYTKAEIDNKLSTLETNIDWKESVATYNSILTTYPTPIDGWTVNVNDTDITYRFNGTDWIPISANAIPKATTSVDGLMTKEDKVILNDVNAKKHEHSNKTVLDGITATKVTNWDSTISHVTDPVKHITAQERLNWNAKTNTVFATIGNGSLSEFTVNHKLGTTNVATSIIENATGETVFTEVFIIDANNIKVIFGSAPSANQYTVTISGTSTQVAIDGSVIVDGGTF